MEALLRSASAEPATKPATKPAGKTGKKPKGAPPPRRRLWVSIVKWTAIAGLAGIALGAATLAFMFWMYGRDPNLPNIKKLADYKPSQVTVIVDANDRRIGEIYTQRRTVVPYAKIPPLVVDAFVAAEDNNFWTHGGIDYWGMVRALIANLKAGKPTQGASTITQQVVKNMVLSSEKSFRRKFQEIILARRLESSLTKQEIMELYLNEIYLGSGRYGIEEASLFYFGKHVGQLDPGEAAVLASFPKAPELLSKELLSNPQRVKDRQTYVLNQLVSIGKLSQADATKYINAPIRIVENPFPQLGSAPEWIELAKTELVNQLGGADKLDKAGAVVRTTLDPGLQAAAQQALQDGLRAVDARHKIGRAHDHVDKVDTEIAKLAKRLPSKGPVAKETYDAVVTAVNESNHELAVDLGKWPATLALDTPDDARYNPEGKPASERFKIGDVIEVQTAGPHKVVFAPGPEGAVVVMEVKTRKVRALVGGYSTKIGGFNRATMAKRQPGSCFKGIVYTTALDSGKYTPATIVNDAPEVFDLWKPKNYETGKFEGPVRLRHGLAKSINTVSIHVTHDVTPDAVVEMAHKMGIVSELPHEMSLALGSGVVTPLEIVNAYATLASGGTVAAPRFVEAIDGKQIPTPQGTQALRPEVAYVATSMLTSVVQEGTATKAKALKIPIAGKTGTSNDSRDTWFIGFTPDYVVGVWIGFDDNHPMGRTDTGGSNAVPVFVDVMKSMNQPAKQFVKPAHVVEKLIDKETGLLAPDGAPKGTTLSEVFVEGTEPTETAPMPGEQTEQTSVTEDYSD
jgi:penicillin-binding protein 1A